MLRRIMPTAVWREKKYADYTGNHSFNIYVSEKKTLSVVNVAFGVCILIK